MTEQEIKKQSRGEAFISYVSRVITSDTAKAAALKRADNPALEHQSWEILNRVGVDLTHHQEREIFCLIAAAAAKAKIKEDGSIGIGAAIANCYENKNQNDQACAKIRRLIACDSTEELCTVLRPLLQFVASRTGTTLSYAKLLDELLLFRWNSVKIKARWAQNFYNQKPIGEEDCVC